MVRGGCRTVATSKMERFVIIVNSWKMLTFITKCSIWDVAAVLDLPLVIVVEQKGDKVKSPRFINWGFSNVFAFKKVAKNEETFANFAWC